MLKYQYSFEPTMAFFGIHLLRSQYLAGQNRWAYKAVLETIVDISDFEEQPTADLTNGFNERLLSILPGLNQHTCGAQAPGGFLMRLETGTWIGHVLEHVIIELHSLIGLDDTFGQTRQTSRPGVYFLVFASPHEKLAREIFHCGRELVLAAFNQQNYDLTSCIQSLKDTAYQFLPGPSTKCIIDAAKNQETPYLRPTNYNLFQLGYACNGRLFWTSMTEKTSVVAFEISKNKVMTKELLAGCFIPVSEGAVVSNATAAWTIAKKFGRSVVKPLDGNRGHGVSLDLTKEKDVRNAFKVAKKYSQQVLVEKYYPGTEYRFFLVNHKIVGILTGSPVYVTGDGSTSIKKLIEQLNQEPERGFNESYTLTAIDFDELLNIQLQKQDMGLDSIPAAQQKIEVRKNFNLAEDLDPELFNQQILDQITLASRIINLDITGIDTIIKNIQLPLGQDNGVVLEVNAGPACALHEHPLTGTSRPIGQHIYEHIMGDRTEDFLLIGAAGSRVSKQMMMFIREIYCRQNKTVGMVLSEGIYLDDLPPFSKNQSLFHNAQCLLINRHLQVGIIQSDMDSLLNYGLAYEKNTCAITILMHVDHDQYQHACYIDSAKNIKKVFRTPLDLVPKNGLAIINGDDPILCSWIDLVNGAVTIIATQENINLLLPLCNEKTNILWHNQNAIMLINYQSRQCIANCNLRETDDIQSLMVGLAIAKHQDMNYCEITQQFANIMEDKE